jgi:hypothetical protein
VDSTCELVMLFVCGVGGGGRCSVGTDSTADIRSGCFPLLPERWLSWWDCNIQNYRSSFCGKTSCFGPEDVNNSIIVSTHIAKVCSSSIAAPPLTTKVFRNRFELNCRVGELHHVRTGMKFLLDSSASVDTLAHCRGFATKVAAPGAVDATAGIEERLPQEEHQEKEEPRSKTLDDFQHEEVVGPTVERDTSPLANEVRQSLAELKMTILGFRKGLLFLGALQGLGACWSYFSWQTMNPSWQLLPSMLSSLFLAFALRQVVQPMTFFGTLEERSRLRLLTLCLMIFKGFETFFERGRIFLTVSAATIAAGLLVSSWPLLAALLGFK